MSPPYGELGLRQCRLVSYERNLGFYDIHFADLSASYDPARGLVFDVPVEVWVSDGYSVVRGLITTVNQATGEVRAELVSE